MTKTILMLVLTAAACPATSFLYSNTTTDQQFSVFYSTGFTQIGDQLHLASPGTLASLDAQFFNDGSDATFDALLSFYNIGAPVGSQIGGSFAGKNKFIASNTSQTVTFSNLGGLLVPQNVIVVLSIQNVSAGGDVGVNFFDAPTAGSSDNSFFIVNDGTGFAQASTNLNIDNVYFEIDGATVPEPATVGVTFAFLVFLAYYRRRRAGVWIG